MTSLQQSVALAAECGREAAARDLWWDRAGGSPYGPVMDAEAQRQLTVGSRFMGKPLRQELQQRAYAVEAQLDPEAQVRLAVCL